MKATPLFDALAARKQRLDEEWRAALRDARVGLYWHGTWDEKARVSHRPSIALDVLVPQQLPLPAGATRLTLDGGAL